MRHPSPRYAALGALCAAVAAGAAQQTAQAQITGVSSITTSAGVSAPTQRTANGASASNLDAATTYTMDFAGGSLALESLTAGGTVYQPGAAGRLALRRSSDGTRPLHEIWYRGTRSGDAFDLEGRFGASAEEVLGDNDMLRGVENVFGNQGSLAGTNSNIERLDVIFDGGLTASTALAFALFERGVAGAHDPIRVAAITSLGTVSNAQGTFNAAPTGFGSLVGVGSAVYGPGVLPAASYLVTRDEPIGSAPERPALFLPPPGVPQQVAGVLVGSLDLGLAAGQTFFGFSLFAEDVDAAGDLVNWLSAAYPLTTSGGAASQGAGIELVGTGARAYVASSAATVPEPATLGLLLLAAAPARIASPRRTSRR